MDEEKGIYRGEVMTIMGILADICVEVDDIRHYLLGDDDEWEAEEEEDDGPPDS